MMDIAGTRFGAFGRLKCQLRRLVCIPAPPFYSNRFHISLLLYEKGCAKQCQNNTTEAAVHNYRAKLMELKHFAQSLSACSASDCFSSRWTLKQAARHAPNFRSLIKHSRHAGIFISDTLMLSHHASFSPLYLHYSKSHQWKCQGCRGLCVSIRHQEQHSLSCHEFLLLKVEHMRWLARFDGT